MKNTAVIILNYNDPQTTSRLVDSILTWQQEQLHIVVVDNVSTDDSYRFLSERYRDAKNTTVLLSEKNGGYSYGNNYGMKYAMEQFRPEYLAIANPDILVDEPVFEAVLETLESNAQVAMAAPVMVDLKGNYRIGSQSLPSYGDDLKACFNSSVSRTLQTENLPYLNGDQALVLTQMITGSFFIIKSAIFEKIGYFDEGVFLFCEERILGRKLADAGYLAVIRADLRYVHAHSTSIKKAYSTVRTWKILLKSRYYYEKNYNHCSSFSLLWLKLCMDGFLCGLWCKLTAYSIIKGKGR